MRRMFENLRRNPLGKRETVGSIGKDQTVSLIVLILTTQQSSDFVLDMKKVLFIDRDGTIIKEPPTDFQVDSLEKLEFYPKAISNLRKIAEETDYELVIIINHGGLGNDCFPVDHCWLAQYKMLKTLEEDGVIFSAILIDEGFEHENAPSRKPRTGLLT